MMMKAFDKVNAAVGSEWMQGRGHHKKHFNEGVHDFTDKGTEMKFTGRLDKFTYNMLKAGKRFDNFNCNCPASTTNNIPDITGIMKHGDFIRYMVNAGYDMECGKERHVKRKILFHARKILRLDIDLIIDLISFCCNHNIWKRFKPTVNEFSALKAVYQC